MSESADWAKEQQENYDEMYSDYFTPERIRAMNLARKVYQLILENNFTEGNIPADVQAKFKKILFQISGIEELFYEELSKLLNKGKSVVEIKKLSKDEIDEIEINNAKFGYLIGNYMQDGKFDEVLVDLVYSNIEINLILYDMIRGSNLSLIVGTNKYDKNIFYHRIWQFETYKAIMQDSLESDPNFLVLIGQFKAMEVNQTILGDNLSYIYNFIFEKGDLFADHLFLMNILEPIY